jgi:hypothetical protein
MVKRVIYFMTDGVYLRITCTRYYDFFCINSLILCDILGSLDNMILYWKMLLEYLMQVRVVCNFNVRKYGM